MKKNNKGLAFPLIVTAILAVSVHCQNPFDKGPGDDNLLPPPGPPVLIAPADKSTIYDPWPKEILLDWSAVEGAESYDVGISHFDSTFTSTQIISSATPGCIYTINGDDTTFWRVRAYSTKWEWYTEWSAVWKFVTYSPVTVLGVSHRRAND